MISSLAVSPLGERTSRAHDEWAFVLIHSAPNPADLIEIGFVHMRRTVWNVKGPIEGINR
jgi:hypothetical protein